MKHEDLGSGVFTALTIGSLVTSATLTGRCACSTDDDSQSVLRGPWGGAGDNNFVDMQGNDGNDDVHAYYDSNVTATAAALTATAILQTRGVDIDGAAMARR